MFENFNENMTALRERHRTLVDRLRGCPCGALDDNDDEGEEEMDEENVGPSRIGDVLCRMGQKPEEEKPSERKREEPAKSPPPPAAPPTGVSVVAEYVPTDEPGSELCVSDGLDEHERDIMRIMAIAKRPVTYNEIGQMYFGQDADDIPREGKDSMRFLYNKMRRLKKYGYVAQPVLNANANASRLKLTDLALKWIDRQSGKECLSAYERFKKRATAIGKAE